MSKTYIKTKKNKKKLETCIELKNIGKIFKTCIEIKKKWRDQELNEK